VNPVRTVRCEPLDRLVTLPVRPQRVVCFVSGWTEALWAMGLAERVVGVSRYCRRYVDTAGRVVAGDYLRIDEAVLDGLAPDLVLMTGGVQLGVARRLAAAGRPVFVLPLPDSFAGVLDNIRRLGALLGEMGAAHALTARLEAEAAALRAQSPAHRPRVYAELWFGRHPRMAGGLTFIHDLIELAGGENLWGQLPEGYPQLDLPGVVAARPEVVVLFHEEDDHPLEVAAWRRERGWDGLWPFRLVEAGIARGRNLIHDGPSLLETARWLQSQLDPRKSLIGNRIGREGVIP
jgi:ABC-type Fe3+-hydroxamate transport system substrate-binding protein